jgi:hypothetical protein
VQRVGGKDRGDGEQRDAEARQRRRRLVKQVGDRSEVQEPASMANSATTAPSSRRLVAQPTRHAGTNVLRHAKALATCPSTTAVNVTPEAASSVAPPGKSSPGRQPAVTNTATNAASPTMASQHPERAGEQPPVEEVVTDRRALEHPGAGGSAPRANEGNTSVPMSRARIWSTPMARGGTARPTAPRRRMA